MVPLGIALFATVVVLGLLYGVYALSPERRWRRRVRLAERALAQRQLSERRRLAQLQWNLHQTQQHLLEQALSRQLAALPVEELDRFPGIGPKTVAGLRAAGMSNLEQVRRQLTGLPTELRSRAGLVQAAVRQLSQELVEGWRKEPKRLPPDLYQRWAYQQECHERDQAESQARLKLLADLSTELQRYQAQFRSAATLWAFWRRLLGRVASPLPADALSHPLLDIEGELIRREKLARVCPVPVPSADELLDLEIRLLYMLARADGRLAKQELGWIRDYCQRHFTGDQTLANRVRCLCAHYEQAKIDAQTTWEKLRQYYRHKRWGEIWPELIQLAQLGNQGNGRKQQTLEQLSRIFHLPLPPPPQEAPAETKSESQPGANRPSNNGPVEVPGSPKLDNTQARQLLGLPMQGPLIPEQIRKQYRELLPLYDPEKEKIKGPEFVALAEQKRLQLHTAACLLLAELGISDVEGFLEQSDSPVAEYRRENPALDAIFGM